MQDSGSKSIRSFFWIGFTAELGLVAIAMLVAWFADKEPFFFVQRFSLDGEAAIWTVLTTAPPDRLRRRRDDRMGNALRCDARHLRQSEGVHG